MKELIFLLLPLLVPLKASALELALEENRGESGTIGYVDIDKVFKEYSGTTGARDEFLGEIKKKEDAVNNKKTEIFALRAEIAKLEQERELARTLPSLLETQRSVEAAVAGAARQEAPLSTGAAQAFNPAQQTEQPPATSTSAVQEVKTSTAAAQPQTAPAGQQTLRMPTGLPGMEGLNMPETARTPANNFKFSVSTSVPEIDAALAKKEDELKTKENELRVFQKDSERELLNYESHKSELILGRIYTALKELAVKEEVSVIVDKRNILYGQNAVDLTDKLIRKLENGDI